MKSFLILFGGLLLSQGSFAQNDFEHTLKLNENEGSPAASIEDVSWISGHWIGRAMGGDIEEIWSEPMAGSMMGAFKLVLDGEVSFYELETISEENNTLVLRIKHFNSDFTGWEEKDESEEFKLVKITEDTVYFDELTFQKVGNDTLNIYVVIGGSGGPKEILFKYNRVN